MGRMKLKEISAQTVFLLGIILLIGSLIAPKSVEAGGTLCAQVKIEIRQELTLERQAFDAHMRINNGLTHVALEDVKVVVTFADENGNAVQSSADPNASSEDNEFFVRKDSEGMSLEGENVWNISSVDPSTSRDIHWLIIPVPGTGENSITTNTLYYVGATLTYTIGGEPHETKVTPDYIYVKPLPRLQLDYFLPEHVYGDDAETPDIEPVEPFNLGVRVKNNGHGTAHDLKIDSAQPEIVENTMGLLIEFLITGSEVNGQPATDSLLVDFGDIAPQRSGMARWIMECTLSGDFTEFKAYLSHSDELGGELTSLIKQSDLNTHVLVHDVLVDLPGRDHIRDFLSKRDVNSNLYRVYESDSEDHEVAKVDATLTPVSGDEYSLNLSGPVMPGFVYAEVKNLGSPLNGGKYIKEAVRSDGKVIKPDNVWFSRTRDPDAYHFNLFDVDSTGTYTILFDDFDNRPDAPAMTPVADTFGNEGDQISFIVSASDPNGTIPMLSASPLPAGATFVDQGDGTGIFDWYPQVGQAGTYKIVFAATDGMFTTTNAAVITVYKENDSDQDGMDDAWENQRIGNTDQDGDDDADLDGITNLDEYLNGSNPAAADHVPTVPVISQPADQAEVTAQTLNLVVENSTDDDGDALIYDFEIYRDPELTDLVDYAEKVPEGAGTTAWTVTETLSDHQTYHWRARARDGYSASTWAYGTFFVNTANEPPGDFYVSYPSDGTTVSALRPVLEVTNAKDPDGDEVLYTFEVYSDPGLTTLTASSPPTAEGTGGTTAWTPDLDLADGGIYYWKVIARDEHGLQTETAVSSFTVDTGVVIPTSPVIVSPVDRGEVRTLEPGLVVNNAAGSGPLTYYFEIDMAPTFDSPARQVSGGVNEGVDTTSWHVTGLSDNTFYYWRVKAGDGQADSPWAHARFFVNEVNETPSVPVVLNPGDESWPDTRAPVFEIAAALDPDQDLITYEFEVFSGPDLMDLVASGRTSYLLWSAPEALDNNTRYYWQVRAVDEHGLTSGWSRTHAFFVRSLSANDPPRITLLSPDTDIITNEPVILIKWDDSDANNNANINLYYDTDNTGADGERIVIGLREEPEGDGDTYEWDTEGIEGTYYIYGHIDDNDYSAISYAPGRVTLDYTAPTGAATPSGGTYPDACTVELTASEQSRIYYTLNGDDPIDTSDIYSGPLSITQTTALKYMVRDLAGNQSEIYTQTYVIGAANPPQAADDAYAVDEDTLLSIAAPGVLENDTDADLDALTAVLETDVSHGTLTLNQDGSFTYQPALNYHGTDTFTYHANDGGLDSGTATVTLTINPVNDPPDINMSAPASDVLTMADALALQWQDSDPDSNADISLFYDTDNTGADGTLIVSGLSEDPDDAQDSYSWDISSLEGTYYVYAVIQDSEFSDTSYAAGRVTIDHTPPSVTADPSGGTFTEPQTITLTASEDAEIYYTLDNSTPTSTSAVYTGPIAIDATTTLQAMAVDQAGLQGSVIIENYVIEDNDLTVHVETSTGRILEGIKVYAFTETNAYTNKNGTTDAGGNVIFDAGDFTPGPHKFRIDYLGSQFWSVVVSLPETKQVDVIIQEENVAVFVTTSTGPPENVKVYLFSDTGSYLNQNQITDTDGRVSFLLPVGEAYKFRADIMGSQYWSDIITVVAPGPNNVNLTAGGGHFQITVQEEPLVPMTGVKVYLFSEAGSYLNQFQVTDDNGQVGFDVPEASYKVRADYLGYRFWSEPVQVVTDTNGDLIIPHQDVTVTVNTIFQADTQPLEAVRVYLFTEAGSYMSRYVDTSAAGEAVFHLPQQPYKTRIDYLGRQYWTVPFTWEDVTYDIPMADARITVTGGGFPMSGEPVYVFTTSDAYLGINGTTDTQGILIFRLPEGSYKFRADHQGSHYWSGEELLTAHQENPVTISTGGGSIIVSVLKGPGEPMEGINCYAFTTGGSYLNMFGGTNSSGEVSFDLADGGYRFRADYLGSHFWSPDMTVPDVFDAEITIPHETSEVTVETGQGLEPGVKVYLFSDADAYLGQYQTTDANGKASFELPVGQAFKFRADLMGSQYWSDIITIAGGSTNPVTVDCGGGFFRVTVQEGPGVPMEGIRVYLFGETGSYLNRSVLSDAAGLAGFSVPDGTYKVRADYLGYQFWSDPVPVFADTDITLTLAHQPVEIDVSGIYQGLSDPIEGIKVYLFSPTNAYLDRQLTTDATGKVTFSLPDREYKVRADYLGRQFWSDPFISQNTPVEIPMAEALVTVTGGGFPSQGGKVYVFTETGSYLNMNQTTDTAGQVRFRLPAGSYKFRVDHQGNQYWTDVEPLGADQENEVILSTGGGRFTLTVLSSAGNPLHGANGYVFSESGSYLNMLGATDENGQVFFDLADGTIKFRVDHLGYQFWTPVLTVPAFLTDTLDLAQQDVTVTVQGQYAVTEPLEGLKVYLFTPAGSYLGQYEVTDASGQVLFNLTDREFMVRVDYLGGRFWSDVFRYQDYTQTIAQGKVNVHAHRTGTDTENAKVYLFTETGSYLNQYQYTDTAGMASFILPEMPFKFRVDEGPDQVWSPAVGVTGGAETTVEVDLD